ncbi:MAG TPA: DUF6268 family outer membrane beta-barrel protein [Flavobacterium sp.]|jgi:hypothetical protein
MRKIILLVFILVGTTVKAQTLNDPIYINYSFLPKTDFENKTGGATTHFIELNATFPALEFGKSIKLFNALYYRTSDFEYTHTFPERGIFPSRLHDIRYSAILRAQVSKDWELIAIPRVMVRSDLNQKLNGNDLFTQVVVLGNYAVKGNPNFKIGLGIALNNDFERNAIIPIGSLYYDSKKIKIEIVYPNANLLYKQSPSFEFGIFATVDGAISRVSPFQTGTETVNYLRTFQLLLAPTVSHRLYKNIFGHAKIGFVPVRNFEFMNSNFKAFPDQKLELNPSLFFRAGISFRLNNN